MQTELCELFYKYSSDKCPQVAHSYSPHYYDLLKYGKESFAYVLEIGIGNDELMKPLYGDGYQIGASLKAWRDFFPNAKIYGLDIRKDVFFSDERIECVYTDQSSSKELNKTISKIKKSNKNKELLFDLIIDDGSHIPEHMILSFETLGCYVKKGGYYIIEDIKNENIDLFINLKVDGFEIAKIHAGATQQDDFIAYRKIS